MHLFDDDSRGEYSATPETLADRWSDDGSRKDISRDLRAADSRYVAATLQLQQFSLRRVEIAWHGLALLNACLRTSISSDHDAQAFGTVKDVVGPIYFGDWLSDDDPHERNKATTAFICLKGCENLPFLEIYVPKALVGLKKLSEIVDDFSTYMQVSYPVEVDKTDCFLDEAVMIKRLHVNFGAPSCQIS